MGTLALKTDHVAPRPLKPTVSPSRPPMWLTISLLALITIALYWPVLNHDFVTYDDTVYVTENPHVQAGLTWHGLAWAFGQIHGERTYWHPLTWMSHMLDCQCYGLRSWGHHLTNLLLHVLNTALVFAVFRRLTGAYWRCAALAVLFAVHPLQVDTVAWVSERKNLLAALFWLLTLWTYASVQSPGSRAHGQQSRFTFHISPWYLLCLAFFTLGLMCKPVLVTLPFVLLLLDYWPFQRNAECGLRSAESWGRLVWEKVPFFVLAAASSTITLLAHKGLGMLDPASAMPLTARLANALVSYARYLGKTVWPTHLAVLYPYPAAWPTGLVLLCAVLLIALSALALRLAPKRGWCMLGWFWFLGVLVPFIGLIQAGAQAMADRFMYVPIIGLLLLLVWALSGLAGGRRYARVGLSALGLSAVLLCTIVTRRQLAHWRDSEALFRHAIAVTTDSPWAHINLGVALVRKGQPDEAIRHYHEALRLKPGLVEAHNDLGGALQQIGRIDEAIEQYSEAIRLKPDQAEAYNNLGITFAGQGQHEQAIAHYRKAIHLKPDYAEAYNNLGAALSHRDQSEEAMRCYEKALRLNPRDAEAHNNLGLGFYRQGRLAEAASRFEQAVRLKPNYADARNNLGSTLYALGRVDEAIAQFQEVLRLRPDDAPARQNLQTALAAKAARQ